MHLLTIDNPKTSKGEKLGYRTAILYLAPANESGVMNTCQFASEGCATGCLYGAGMAAVFPTIKAARIRKTELLASDKPAFLAMLREDIAWFKDHCQRAGLIPAIRVNGTSDLAWLGMQMAAENPDIQFYDYTKLPKPWLRTRANYHLTFSLNENNMQDAVYALEHGINVAVVFDTKRGEALPKRWALYRVVDGDAHDLRFLDKPFASEGIVIGLRAKGPAKKDVHGFVQIAA